MLITYQRSNNCLAIKHNLYNIIPSITDQRRISSSITKTQSLPLSRIREDLTETSEIQRTHYFIPNERTTQDSARTTTEAIAATRVNTSRLRADHTVPPTPRQRPHRSYIPILQLGS